MTETATQTTDTLVVAEVFGPTIQGEGPSTGVRASFIRTGGCNLACSWCDTPYTWDATRYDLRTEMARRPVAEIVDTVLAHDTPLIVITGGEPLLHQRQPGWTALITALRDAGRDIEIETNGTIAPTTATIAAGCRFNVSPKLAHSGDPEDMRLVPGALAALVGTGRAAVFKFVATGPADLDEIATFTARAHIPDDLVWVMPEGTTPDTVLAGARRIADDVITRGWNLTLRAHVLLWPDDERGR